tara:strand:- start:796 stop:2376 length:1581 start_codon:yes stop_codon:yes gene_type:complete
MKITNLSGITVGVLSLLAVFFTSCSDPQKQAQRSLEEKGYSLTARDLFLAAGSGDLEGIDLFMETGMDIDSADDSGNTALIKAASAGQIMAVEKILGLGADPRHVNDLGRDGLLTSSAKGYEDVARMLLSRGADMELRDVEGWSALSIAAYNGHANIVSLLSGQVTSEALDDALLVASFNGDSRVIGTLLGQGANINTRSPDSQTPLMITAAGGKYQAVRILLQNQANPYSEDSDGNTAAILAETGGHEKVKTLILSPDSWGSTPESREVAAQMSEAKQALVAEAGIEETLAEPLDDMDSTADVASAGTPQRESGSSVPATRVAQNHRTPNPDRMKIREEAKAKPVVALNGSTIRSRSPRKAPVESMVLAGFHEEPLSIAVAKVDGKKAEIRRLGIGSEEPVEVTAGAMIPGTPYKVKDVTRKFVSSKEGKGRMVDVSRVRVENTENGATHLLVKDIAGQSSDTYAILTAPNSQYRYVVKSGDVFKTSQPGTGEKEYQVLDIRAGGVVIKDLKTEDVVTVARDGVL